MNLTIMTLSTPRGYASTVSAVTDDLAPQSTGGEPIPWRASVRVG